MKTAIKGDSSRIRWFRPLQRGQTLVEIALVFPFVLLLLAGLIEVGHYVNTYLTVLDASREAARYAADLNPDFPARDDFDPADHPLACGGPVGSANGPDSEACLRLSCEETRYFFRKSACLVSTNLQALDLDLSNENNDVVISVAAVISTTEGLTITERLPPINSACTRDEETYRERATCSTTYCCRDACVWSWTNNVYSGTILAGTGQASHFTCDELAQLLNSGSHRTRRQNGFVIVEVFYEHELALNLPIISQVIPDPIEIRAYSIMPVSAAEPTPTPVP
jgi:hypothetical protein